MLAHITPEEAQMLLESGGSGRMNPMTGLPEFQPDYNYDVEAQEGGFYGEMPNFNYDVEAQPGGFYGEMQQAAVPLQREFVSQPEIPMVTAPAVDRYGMQPQFESPAETMRLQEYAQGLRTPQEVQPSILDRLKGGLQSAETGYQDFTQNYPMLSRLLTTGAASLPSLLAARSARREGGAAADELRALGAPLRQEAENLRRQALTGGLTPQQARQEEARRASMRQAASTRGATSGTQQAMIENTLARERAGLSETNLNNAIKQLNLANAYDEAAIRAKLQSDTQTSQILASIMGDLARATAGQPRGGQQTQQQIQPQMTQEPAVTRRPEVR
jgi:hypothetical protein